MSLIMKPTLTLFLTLMLEAFDSLHAAKPISISAEHTAIVNHQWRIFFQYDPAADIQR